MARNGTWAARVWRAMPPAFIVGWALFLTPGAALAQEGRDEFRQMVDLYEQGKYADAREMGNKALAANPSAETALEMRNEAGYQLFVDMLAHKGDDIATIARKILELAERGSQKDRQELDKIQALIAQMFGDDEETSYRAIETLASQVGPFCVPFMVEHLAARRDNEKRVKAIVLLSKLGPDGSNAVIELLRHKDDFVRYNAAAILGHIRDFKAIPYLKALVESKSETPHVQQEAALALKNITGKEPSSIDSATACFAALAEYYYQEHPAVMVNNFKDWVVWEWKEDKLQYRVVPRYAWNEELAQDTCYAAIRHAANADVRESDLDQVYTILVSVFFQRALETDELLAVSGKPGVDPAEVEALKAAKAKVDALPALATARGEAQLSKALRKALHDRRPSLAVALIRALRDTRMSESCLPADGANLATYIDGGAGPARSIEATARPSEAASSSGSVSQPSESKPAPAPEPKKEEPKAEEPKKEEPKEEPKKEDSQPSGSRRRRVSQAGQVGAELALAQPYTEPATLRTLDGSGEAYGAAMAAALTFEDKRVRYAAAEALLRLAPSRKFASSTKVVENLGAALGENGNRVVLIIARDIQVRNRLVGIVRDLHHLPYAVQTAREGIVRARSNPVQDVVLIDSDTVAEGQPGQPLDFTVGEFLDQVNVDYRTQGTPVIVASPKKSLETDTKAYGDKVKAIVAEDVDPVVLKEKLDALWTGENAKKGDPKGEATEAARVAAEALAAANPHQAVFDLRAAVPGLIGALEAQPDSVRIPALRALGNLNARECVDKVDAIFDNTQNSKELRIAAAYALGEALRGAPMPAKVYEGLKGGLKEGDVGLYRSCAEALGKAQLTREQARDVFIEQRVE